MSMPEKSRPYYEETERDDVYVGQPVSEEASRLDKQVEKVNERLEVLIERLSPVLLPSYPVPESRILEAVPRDSVAPLAGQMRATREHVERIGALIETTLGRVQV